jgi:hypothetical protein
MKVLGCQNQEKELSLLILLSQPRKGIISTHLILNYLYSFLEPRKGIISTHSPTGPCESWESIVVEFDDRIIQFDQKTGQSRELTQSVEKVTPGHVPPLRPRKHHC